MHEMSMFLLARANTGCWALVNYRNSIQTLVFFFHLSRENLSGNISLIFGGMLQAWNPHLQRPHYHRATTIQVTVTFCLSQSFFGHFLDYKFSIIHHNLQINNCERTYQQVSVFETDNPIKSYQHFKILVTFIWSTNIIFKVKKSFQMSNFE